ncbi:MAG: hypothetical protein ACK4VV_03275 [Pseudomonas sp.]
MSVIGWIFALVAMVTIFGGLYKLYISAYRMPIDKDKMVRIKARQAELEEQEAREKDKD